MRTILFLLICTPLLLNATPSDGIRENETLIGYNNTHYYTIKAVQYPTGNYYRRIDSTFVVERELTTGKLNARICIRATTYIDRSTERDWVKQEYKNDTFDYTRFLLNKNIKYLYPEWFQSINDPSVQLDMLYEGLILQLKNYKVVLMDADDMEPYAPWIKESLELERSYEQKYPKEKFNFVTVEAFVSDDKYTFFMIKSEFDVEILRSVLVMKTDRFKLLQQEVEE